MQIDVALKALANERRLQVLEWLRNPRAHFRPQVDGDLVKDGVCGVLLAEKLGVSPPTSAASTCACWWMRAWCAPKRIKGWTMYKRDEQAIAAFKKAIWEM